VSETVERIIAGLRKAVDAETAGHHFYKMAARATNDEKGSEVFERLAEEELEHVRFLRAQYDSFKEKGAPAEDVKLGSGSSLSGGSPIFSPRIRERIGEAHFEMSALSIAMELELSSTNFYRAEAKASDDPRVREFYERLSAWEAGHYEALKRQQEELKEDYWARGGFSPF